MVESTAIGIYGRLVSARVRSELQYRASFGLFLASQFLVTLLDFVEIAVIFGRVDSLAGWSLGEVAFLYGTTCVPFALADLLVSQVEEVHRRIRSGTFDILLVRPLSPLVQLLADDFALRRLGKVAQAAAVLVIASGLLGLDWTAARLALLAITIASATVIFSALFVLGACIQFFTIDAGQFANAFTYGGNSASQFPLTVYAPWLRRFLVFVVPVAFVNYLPAVALLGKPASDRFGLPAALSYASPAVALAMALIATMAWRASVNRYRSTGS